MGGSPASRIRLLPPWFQRVRDGISRPAIHHGFGSKCVLHVMDRRFFAILDADLDDIETPRDVAGSELPEPCVGAALDQALLVLADRVETADFGTFAAG